MAKAVDLAPFPKADKTEDDATRENATPVACCPPHGTAPCPESDGDIWLAAAFADYEKIVALEKSLSAKRAKKSLDKDAQRPP